MKLISEFLIIFIILIKNDEILSSSLNNGKFSNANVYRLDSIHLVEEPPIGTLVIDLASKLEINDLATSDYKFRFYSPHSLTAHYFLIDQLTGHVKTQRSLDREYLCETKACGPCQNGNNCTIPIEIVASHHLTNSHKNKLHQSSSSQPKFVSFDVVIEDKNEFAPQFQRDSIVLNISENTPANFRIPLDPAVDRDSRQTSIYYSLVPVMLKKHSNDEEFIETFTNDLHESELKLLNAKVRLSTSPATSQSSTQIVLANPSSANSYNNQQLNLVIVEPFDYESDKEVYFKILASDGVNQPYLTGSCLVTLKIVDLNDNLPVFDKLEYEYRLDEDKAVSGTRLIRVHATDRDSASNGLVKYYLVDQTITASNTMQPQQQQQQQNQQQQTQFLQVKNLFQIDELTGWISVAPAANLDFEQISVYRLTVRAQDSGVSNSMPVYTNVVIYLNDVNDNRPEISLTVPSDEFSPASASTLTSSSINEREISEWTLPDTFLAQVVVSDSDSGLNGKLKLDMSQVKKKSGSDEWQSSDDFTLIHLFNNIYSLMTKNALDRELFDLYKLNVSVSDCGQTSLATWHMLTVRVRDENDNSPVFLPVGNVTRFEPNSNKTILAYEFEIYEESVEKNNNEWIKLGQIKASDADLNENAHIKYELEFLGDETKCNKSSDILSSQFQIDSKTGVLSARKAGLDRELCEQYEFKVIARDNNQEEPTLSPSSSSTKQKQFLSNQASVKLSIHLIDRNDNAPLFEHAVYRFQILENTQILPMHLGHVRAVDYDKPNTSFSHIKYSLAKPNSQFKINETTGDLYLIKALDYEKWSVLEFKIIAYDNQNLSGSLNSTSLIRVEVVDLNDNRPTLQTPSDSDLPLVYSFSDSDLINSHYFKLFKLNASDLDSNEFGRVTFKLEKQFRLKPDATKSDEEENGKFHDLKKFMLNNEVNLFECDQNGFVSLRLKKFKKTYKNHRLNEDDETVFSVSNENYENLFGIYGLVVKLSDSAPTPHQLSSKAFILIALDKNKTNELKPNEMNQTFVLSKFEKNVIYLRELIAESGLNSLVVGEEDLSEERFKRLVAMFNMGKRFYLSGAQKNGESSSQFGAQFVNAFDEKNFKYLLLFMVGALAFITLVVGSLCMSVYFYRQKREREEEYAMNGGARMKVSDEMEKLNEAATMMARNKMRFGQTQTVVDFAAGNMFKSNLIGSASPTSSLTTSEIIDNSHYLAASSDENLKRKSTKSDSSNEKVNNLKDDSECGMSSAQNSSSDTGLIRMTRPGSTNQNKKSSNTKEKPKLPQSKKSKFEANENSAKLDLNTSGEEVLIVDTNSPSTNNTTASSSSSSSHSTEFTQSTNTTTTLSTRPNKTKYSHNLPLMVILPSNKMVASTESLSSLNTSNMNIPKTSTLTKPTSTNNSQDLINRAHKNIPQSPNNFKTFKAITNSPQQTNSNNLSTNQDFSYRTMPVNGYRNLITESNFNSPNQTPTKTYFDQKPLNLPVNELYRRYELKKQASSGSLTSINQIQLNINNQKLYSSPKSAQKLLNQVKLNIEPQNFTNNNSPIINGQIPDYFFKDEKEFKKFLANNNKQKLNCKHIIDPQQQQQQQQSSNNAENSNSLL